MRNYTQTYQYDEIGNLLQMKSGTVWTRDYYYHPTSDDNDLAENNYLQRHTATGTNLYLYDAHGNTTKMPYLQELKYDYADQLNEVTLDASNNKAYYIYDAGGDRVRKVVVKNNGTIIEDRFYIGDYEIYTKKTNGSLDVKRETLHIIDDKQKVALIDTELDTNDLILATTIRYQYTNHLDSASLELDETGDIISYEEYHPFGTTSYRSGRSATEVSLKRYKYIHKELDNETGLYYYGMRYYASWIARFISVDPLQFKYPELTPFQYASNRPISGIDLDGAEFLQKTAVRFKVDPEKNKIYLGWNEKNLRKNYPDLATALLIPSYRKNDRKYPDIPLIFNSNKFAEGEGGDSEEKKIEFETSKKHWKKHSVTKYENGKKIQYKTYSPKQSSPQNTISESDLEILKKEGTYYPSVESPFAYGSGAAGAAVAEIVKWDVEFKKSLAILDIFKLDVQEWQPGISRAINLVYAAFEMGLLDYTGFTENPYELADLLNSIISYEYCQKKDISDKVHVYNRYLIENEEAILNNDIDNLKGGKIKALILKRNELNQN